MSRGYQEFDLDLDRRERAYASRRIWFHGFLSLVPLGLAVVNFWFMSYASTGSLLLDIAIVAPLVGTWFLFHARRGLLALRKRRQLTGQQTSTRFLDLVDQLEEAVKNTDNMITLALLAVSSLVMLVGLGWFVHLVVTEPQIFAEPEVFLILLVSMVCVGVGLVRRRRRRSGALPVGR